MQFLSRRMERMLNLYTPAVNARPVTHILDRLDLYKSVYGARQDFATKLSIGADGLRRPRSFRRP